MEEPSEEIRLKEGVAVHIFSVSAAMVGVCLTAIGIMRVVITLRHITTIADDLLAIDAVLFLISCLTSYGVLRTSTPKKLRTLEHIADATFLAGMVFMVVACGVITWALGVS